jgi:hypothetical protein
MTRLSTAALIALAALTFTAKASANVPYVQDRIDAKKFAVHYWTNRGDYNPCEGRLGLIFYPFRGTSEADDWGYTFARGSCTVYMNSSVHWSWWKLCATTIHEVGHVFGHAHHRWQPASIMYPRMPNPRWGYHFSDCEYTT